MASRSTAIAVQLSNVQNLLNIQYPRRAVAQGQEDTAPAAGNTDFHSRMAALVGWGRGWLARAAAGGDHGQTFRGKRTRSGTSVSRCPTRSRSGVAHVHL